MFSPSSKVNDTKITTNCYRWLNVIVSLVCLAFISNCASFRPPKWDELEKPLPLQKEISSVPFYPQEAYQCGPAALAMVLEHNGIAAGPEALASEIYTPSLRGSLQSALIGSARRHGQIAYVISQPEALLKEVSHGNPVIVLQNLGFSWIPVWHYAVVFGYDLNNGYVLLHSGLEPGKKVSVRLFNNTWRRSNYWGLLVLPPASIPITAEEEKFIEAVIGLEKAHRWQAAINGYQAALNKWGASQAALIGLGNSYYAQRQPDLAESVFREATLKFPSSGVAFNNLAQVLLEQGKKEDALSASLKAVDIGGPMKAAYQQTLDDIQEVMD